MASNFPASLPRLAAGLLALTLGLAGCKTESRPAALGVGGVGTVRGGELTLRDDTATPEEASNVWKYPNYPNEYDVEPLNRDYLSDREGIAEFGSYAGPWLEGREAKELPVAPPNILEGEAVALAFTGLKLPASGASEAPTTGTGTGTVAPTAGSTVSEGTGGQGETTTTGSGDDELPGNAYARLQRVVSAIRSGRGGPLEAAFLPRLTETPFQVYLKLKAGLENALYQEAHLTRDQLWSLTYYLYRAIEPDYTVLIKAQLDGTLKAGKDIFGANCAMCHGSDGWGRGESGHTLQPPPANFNEPRRLYNRSEANLYAVLREGIYGSAMPPWKDKLTEAEIRHVVAYIRSFSYSLDPPVVIDGAGTAGSEATQTREGNP